MWKKIYIKKWEGDNLKRSESFQNEPFDLSLKSKKKSVCESSAVGDKNIYESSRQEKSIPSKSDVYQASDKKISSWQSTVSKLYDYQPSNQKPVWSSSYVSESDKYQSSYKNCAICETNGYQSSNKKARVGGGGKWQLPSIERKSTWTSNDGTHESLASKYYVESASLRSTATFNTSRAYHDRA